MIVTSLFLFRYDASQHIQHVVITDTSKWRQTFLWTNHCNKTLCCRVKGIWKSRFFFIRQPTFPRDSNKSLLKNEICCSILVLQERQVKLQAIEELRKDSLPVLDLCCAKPFNEYWIKYQESRCMTQTSTNASQIPFTSTSVNLRPATFAVHNCTRICSVALCKITTIRETRCF